MHHLNFKIDAKKEHVDLGKAVCGSNMLELEFKMSKQSIDRIGAASRYRFH